MFEGEATAKEIAGRAAGTGPHRASVPIGNASATRAAIPAVLSDPHIEIHYDLGSLEAEWKAFEKDADCTVFQTYDWLAKWQFHIGRRRGIRPVVVTARDAQKRLIFILPFAVETRGVFRRLIWLGRDLCDYNGPLLGPDIAGNLDSARFRLLWNEVIGRIRESAQMRFDLVDLDKMPDVIGASANPFAGLDVLPHASGAHVATLGGDWEKFYAAKRSSATRKKERKKLRQLGALGEVCHAKAENRPDRARAVETLLEQKAHNFARLGIRNIFSRPGNREFFMDIATDPAMRDIVDVSRLDVGKVLAAASIGLRFRDVYYLVLSSYLDNEIARFGPGRVHLHELLRYAISKGFRWFDFTVGDETYKDNWSDKEVNLYDYLEPVTSRGKLALASVFAYRRVKRLIKRTPFLWRAYKMMRSLKARLRGANDRPPEA